MADGIEDLTKARILLSNDDGIHATGMAALERIAAVLSDDVWVVAPDREQSAASHSLTIVRPLRLRRHSETRFSTDGTPTDSVLLAIRHILKDRPPDLVLSGVNRGGNLGEDVTYSGTIAAAMEGTLLGIPSIALSLLAPSDGRAKWGTAEHFAPGIIRRLATTGWPRNVVLNMNIPDLAVERIKGVAVVRQGQRKLAGRLIERRDPRGKPYYWISTVRDDTQAAAGTDLAAINDGMISVTPLYLDLTHDPTVDSLRRAYP